MVLWDAYFSFNILHVVLFFLLRQLVITIFRDTIPNSFLQGRAHASVDYEKFVHAYIVDRGRCEGHYVKLISSLISISSSFFTNRPFTRSRLSAKFFLTSYLTFFTQTR